MELLVVVAIIALVASFAAVAVNSARSKQRDATRLSNVRLLQSASQCLGRSPLHEVLSGSSRPRRGSAPISL
jgi:hypothetical protein